MNGGLNTYGYAYQSPINNYDPDGRLVWFGVPAYYWFAAGGAIAAGGTLMTPQGQKVLNNAVGSAWNALSSSSSSSSSTGAGAGFGGGSNDYCLLNPNDPICKQQFNQNQCPGVSKKNLKHINKHLGQFQQLSPNFTLQQQVNLGQRISSNPNNYVGSSGGRAAYQANITINGQSVPVRVVVNSVNNIRTIYIPGP